MVNTTCSHNNITFRVNDFIHICKDRASELPITHSAIGKIISIDDLSIDIEIIWLQDEDKNYVPPSLHEIHLSLFHYMEGHTVSRISNPNHRY